MALREDLGKALSHPSTRDHLSQQVGGDATTGTKTSKADANYRIADTPDESCGTCNHFDGSGGCDVVAGHINPSHVSDHYSSKKGKASDSASSADTGSQPPDQPQDTGQETQ